MIGSFKDIVNLWRTPDELAIELGAGIEAVRKWRQRDNIPSDWWLAVLVLPKAQEAGLTVEKMAELASVRGKRCSQSAA